MARPKKIFASLPIMISYSLIPFPDKTGLRGRPRSDSHVGFDLDAVDALVQEHGTTAVVGCAMNHLRSKLNADFGVAPDTVYQEYKENTYCLKTKLVGQDLYVVVSMFEY